MKILYWIIFGVAAIAQWAVPATGIWQHEQTLAKGKLYKINCTAPDPYDPLRGRYLAVRPAQSQVNVPPEMQLSGGMTVYGRMTVGDDGLATIKSVEFVPPEDGESIELRVRYVNGGQANVEWPFDRLYLNQRVAPEADKWFAENVRTSEGVIAEVRVRNGRAVLADLSLNGKPFRELLKERVE